MKLNHLWICIVLVLLTCGCLGESSEDAAKNDPERYQAALTNLELQGVDMEEIGGEELDRLVKEELKRMEQEDYEPPTPTPTPKPTPKPTRTTTPAPTPSEKPDPYPDAHPVGEYYTYGHEGYERDLAVYDYCIKPAFTIKRYEGKDGLYIKGDAFINQHIEVEPDEGNKFLFVFVSLAHNCTADDTGAPAPEDFSVIFRGKEYESEEEKGHYRNGDDDDDEEDDSWFDEGILDRKEAILYYPDWEEYHGGPINRNQDRRGFLVFEVPESLEPEEAYVRVDLDYLSYWFGTPVWTLDPEKSVGRPVISPAFDTTGYVFPEEPPRSRIEIKVTSAGNWSGSYGDAGRTQQVAGEGSQTFGIDDPRGCVFTSIEKTAGPGSLIVEILEEGEIVKSGCTGSFNDPVFCAHAIATPLPDIPDTYPIDDELVPVTVKITSTGAWRGWYGTTRGTTFAEGSGDAEFVVDPTRYTVVGAFQKTDAGEALTVEMVKGGESIESAFTVLCDGVAIVTHDPLAAF